MKNVEKIENINVYYTATLQFNIIDICEELDIDRNDIKSYDISDYYELEITMKNGDFYTFEYEDLEDNMVISCVQDLDYRDSEFEYVEV